jgi:hypothetical protein
MTQYEQIITQTEARKILDSLGIKGLIWPSDYTVPTEREVKQGIENPITGGSK